MSFEHACDAPGACRFRGPADCSCGGKIGHLGGSSILPRATLRRYQRRLDEAKTDEEVVKFVAFVESDICYRIIEDTARKERIAHYRRDPVGYRREMRQLHKSIKGSAQRLQCAA